MVNYVQQLYAVCSKPGLPPTAACIDVFDSDSAILESLSFWHSWFSISLKCLWWTGRTNYLYCLMWTSSLPLDKVCLLRICLSRIMLIRIPSQIVFANNVYCRCVWMSRTVCLWMSPRITASFLMLFRVPQENGTDILEEDHAEEELRWICCVYAATWCIQNHWQISNFLLLATLTNPASEKVVTYRLHGDLPESRKLSPATTACCVCFVFVSPGKPEI